MTAVPQDIREVLMQRAAECDVEDLRAATDAQYREPAVQRAPQQR